MRFRPLGSTGLSVSEIGFGCFGIGGGYRRNDAKEAARAVACALDLGINYFDSAPFVYGDSERIVGSVVRTCRDQVILASKVEEFHRLENPVRDCVEQSLQSYGTDYLDIVQLRDPSPERIEQTRFFEEAAALKKEGKIRFAAATLGDTHQTDEGRYALRVGIPIIQLAYNLVFPLADEWLFGEASQAGTGIVVRGPLCKGFLANRLHELPSDISADPNFRWFSAEEGATLIAIQNTLAFLIREDRSLAQAAIQFVLRRPEVSTTIPSLETEADVRELVGALEATPLSDPEIAKARAILAELPPIDY